MSDFASEHFLHPYRIEYLTFFLPNPFEPATFHEPILLVEVNTFGIERRYAGQNIRYAFFDRTLFQEPEQHLPQAFTGMVRMYEICHFGSL